MRRSDLECKKEALRKYFDGQSVASIFRELGVKEGLLHIAAGKKNCCRKAVTRMGKSQRNVFLYRRLLQLGLATFKFGE